LVWVGSFIMALVLLLASEASGCGRLVRALSLVFLLVSRLGVGSGGGGLFVIELPLLLLLLALSLTTLVRRATSA
jgi:hypothetical protein